MSKEYETASSIFYIDEHGIVHKQVKEGINIKAEDAKDDQRMLVNLIVPQQKVLVAVHAEVFHTFRPEGVAQLAKDTQKSRIATAVISTKLGVKIFTDTINLITGGKPPFRMFTAEKEAIEWLLSFKNEPTRQSKIRRLNPSVNTSVNHRHKSIGNYAVHTDKNGIVIKKVHKGSHLTLDMVKKIELDLMQPAQGKQVLTLVDCSLPHTISKEAVKYLQKSKSTAQPRTHGAAALVCAKLGRSQPSAIAHGAKAARAVKVFTQKTEAVKWLLSLKNKPDSKKHKL